MVIMSEFTAVCSTIKIMLNPENTQVLNVLHEVTIKCVDA